MKVGMLTMLSMLLAVSFTLLSADRSSIIIRLCGFILPEPLPLSSEIQYFPVLLSHCLHSLARRPRFSQPSLASVRALQLAPWLRYPFSPLWVPPFGAGLGCPSHNCSRPL